MRVTRGEVTIALDIMRESAQWLIEVGKLMWRIEDLAEVKILQGITPDEVCVGWLGEEAAAAMILQWNDPFFWPQAKGDSGFIHKLAVRRRFAGTGLSRQMVEWAKRETLAHGKRYLRLDCEAIRPGLCQFYESLGFVRIDRRMIGVFDTAFYELELIPDAQQLEEE